MQSYSRPAPQELSRRISGIINELGIRGLIETEVSSGGRYGRTKRIIRI